VGQVQAVGEDLHPGERRHAEGSGERLRSVGGHRRAAVATQRLLTVGQAGKSGVAPHRGAGLGGGGVQHTPLQRQLQLGQPGPALGGLGRTGTGQHRCGVEILDSDRWECRDDGHTGIRPVATDSHQPETAVVPRRGRILLKKFWESVPVTRLRVGPAL
jgi:hypothetical protein